MAESGRLQVGQLAVPLVQIGDVEQKPRAELIGTGFVVRKGESETWLMTAGHVADAGQLSVAPVPTVLDNAAQFTLPQEAVFDVDDIQRSADLDIAILHVAGSWDDTTVTLFGSSQFLVAQLLNIEYSQWTRDEDSQALLLVPSFHVGHVVQEMSEKWRGDGTLTRQIVCSWPAYRGASGSPVFDTGQSGMGRPLVRGMIIDNREMELLPAHFEEIIDDEGTTERHLYYAPNAIAIAYPHLEEFVISTLGEGEPHS